MNNIQNLRVLRYPGPYSLEKRFIFPTTLALLLRGFLFADQLYLGLAEKGSLPGDAVAITGRGAIPIVLQRPQPDLEVVFQAFSEAHVYRIRDGPVFLSE